MGRYGEIGDYAENVWFSVEFADFDGDCVRLVEKEVGMD